MGAWSSHQHSIRLKKEPLGQHLYLSGNFWARGARSQDFLDTMVCGPNLAHDLFLQILLEHTFICLCYSSTIDIECRVYKAPIFSIWPFNTKCLATPVLQDDEGWSQHCGPS